MCKIQTLLGAILALSFFFTSSSFAVTTSVTYNPGLFGIFPSFGYKWTIDAAELPPGGAQQLTIDIDNFDLNTFSVDATGPGLPRSVSGSFFSGPPRSVTITGLLRELTPGDMLTASSGLFPNNVLGLFRPISWRKNNMSAPGGHARTDAAALMGGLMVPMLVPNLAIGDRVVSGTATPNSFVALFQDILEDMTNQNILLGQGQVDPTGNFSIPLVHALTAETLSVGVSPTNSDLPDGGQIALQVSVPEPSAITLFLCGLLIIIAWFGKKKRSAVG